MYKTAAGFSLTGFLFENRNGVFMEFSCRVPGLNPQAEVTACGTACIQPLQIEQRPQNAGNGLDIAGALRPLNVSVVRLHPSGTFDVPHTRRIPDHRLRDPLRRFSNRFRKKLPGRAFTVSGASCVGNRSCRILFCVVRQRAGPMPGPAWNCVMRRLFTGNPEKPPMATAQSPGSGASGMGTKEVEVTP